MCKSFKILNSIESGTTEKEFGKKIYFIKTNGEYINKYSKNIYVKEFAKKHVFLIDTGSDIDCIPNDILPVHKQNDLRHSTVLIKSADNNSLDVVGIINLTLVCNNL